MKIWDGGVSTSDAGVTITGMYTCMLDGDVSEKFLAHLSSNKSGGGTDDTHSAFWCANSASGLEDVLEGGFPNCQSSQLAFAYDPMAAIQGNSTGPNKVVIAKVALGGTQNLNGKITTTNGKAAIPTYVVYYK